MRLRARMERTRAQIDRTAATLRPPDPEQARPFQMHRERAFWAVVETMPEWAAKRLREEFRQGSGPLLAWVRQLARLHALGAYSGPLALPETICRQLCAGEPVPAIPDFAACGTGAGCLWCAA